MRNRRPLQAVVGLAAERLAELVDAAVAGHGPALLPIPGDVPDSHLRRLVETLRPTSMRTPQGVVALADGVPVADDVAVVVSTSGSTGQPKGVELSADALLVSARASTARIGAQQGEPWLCVLPTAHIAGLQVLLRARLLDAPVLFRPFTVEAVQAAARQRPHVSLVPTQLRRLLAAGVDLSQFRTILLGGAAADPGLLAEARRAGGRIVTTYGMSETCGGCVYDGLPLDGVAVDVDAEGRILLAGPVLYRGYRLRPDLTAAHRAERAGRHWFRTSDLGVVDDGRLRVRGRADDVINTGGHKVVAGEVAALLTRLDTVADAVVVGRPDPEWGQRVTAVVVPADPTHPPTLAEIREWVSAHLPRYAAPRELDLRAELPLLPSGKPDVRQLSQG
ncbi:ortho-succinylbenzoate-CoA synthetase [Thermobifida fusca TM51]|uniref:Ortho-succinylbenzoate-CoA synthetase n=1 Tax=Thermobifida fusca TM51 TaxID=1169414 RepID=A0A9P2TAN1_THEFU|nr:AMP-binding protein [Thermobifida fusca]EOR71480.1 ortho-succinylbenzoate-CoA synthetase [Thermobifida fusca TM51]